MFTKALHFILDAVYHLSFFYMLCVAFLVHIVSSFFYYIAIFPIIALDYCVKTIVAYFMPYPYDYTNSCRNERVFYPRSFTFSGNTSTSINRNTLDDEQESLSYLKAYF